MKLEVKTKYNIGDEVYIQTNRYSFQKGIIIETKTMPTIEDNNFRIVYTVKYNKFDTIPVEEKFIFKSKEEAEEYAVDCELNDFYKAMDTIQKNFPNLYEPMRLPNDLMPFYKKLEEIKKMLQDFYEISNIIKPEYQFNCNYLNNKRVSSDSHVD